MENEPLRREIEKYIVRHDLIHLFERLTASMMFDRPDDLNRYACEWLMRLSGSAQEQGVQSKKIAENGDGQRISKHSLNPSLQSAEDVEPLSPGEGEMPVSATGATKSNSKTGHAFLNDSPSGLQFAPFLLSPENVGTFYGVLDPLNVGTVASEHFREVAGLLDLEKYIDWSSIPQNVHRDLLCDQIVSALAAYLASLRVTSGELGPEPAETPISDEQDTPADLEHMPSTTKEDAEFSTGISDTDIVNNKLIFAATNDDEELDHLSDVSLAHSEMVTAEDGNKTTETVSNE